ncbi:hypothetical protein V2J09_021385 [Rumex salicifolius]
MAESKSPAALSSFLQKLNLKSTSCRNLSFKGIVSPSRKTNPPSLVTMCLEVVGKHLEDIIPDLTDIASSFPSHIKMAIAAIARRRKLLNNDIIIALADGSWEVLDVSGSDVTDFGLAKVSEICGFLRAVDISRCSNVTPFGVSELIQNCRSLEILRFGGCQRSDYTARRSLNIIKPKLNDVAEDSWEDLDANEIAHGAQSLRWLVWPKIDQTSLYTLTTECPRIILNPQSSPLYFKGEKVPKEAFPDTVLDASIIEDCDPSIWAICSSSLPRNSTQPISNPKELSIAEKFRLAFVERDMRMAPKRAKNARQRHRREQREWMMTNADAKAIVLASQASKSLPP